MPGSLSRRQTSGERLPTSGREHLGGDAAAGHQGHLPHGLVDEQVESVDHDAALRRRGVGEGGGPRVVDRVEDDGGGRGHAPGGKGGGKDDLAQGGGSDGTKAAEALKAVADALDA